MKVGLSIYSLSQAIDAGEMTPLEAIQWIADNGGRHMEIVSFVVDLVDNDALLEAVAAKARETGVEISAYCLYSDVLDREGQEYDEEIRRIYKHLDITRRLGAKIMRTDFTKWGRPPESNVIENYERDLPKLVEICRTIAAYAKPLGITVTVENHGTYINGGDRVRRLITAVDRENFRCTLDIGNSLCVDEDPMVCVKTLLPWAATIHFKDFLIRRNGDACGASGPAQFAVASWLTTNFGSFIRGSIVGDGDVDVVGIMKYIRESGYDGTVAIEFEGMEDCRIGSKISMDNVRRYLTL